MRSFTGLRAVALAIALGGSPLISGCEGCSCAPDEIGGLPPAPSTAEKTLSVRPGEASLALGESVTLAAFLDDEDVTAEVSWSASSEAASVEDGVVTGLAEGEAIITAELGTRSATAEIAVTDAALLSLAVVPGEVELPVGRTVTFVAQGTFSDDTTRAVTAGLSWHSDDDEVATISNEGLAQALLVGEAGIRARVGPVVSPAATLSVLPPAVEELVISPGSAAVASGETQAFTASASLSDGSTADVTASASWASTAASIATVEEGTATGHAPGSVEITASLEGVQSPPATLEVGAAVVTQVVVTPGSGALPLGGSQPFTATVTWSDGSETDETAAATWTTTDAGVVTIDEGTALATGIGTAQLTAAVDDVTSESVPVTVTGAVIASIALTPPSSSIAKGESAAFVATATFTDGSTQDISETATWTSSSPSVAEVTAGTALGLQVGAVEIVAAEGGVISPPAALTVTEEIIVALTVSPEEASVAEGGTQAFVATATWSDGSETDVSATASWVSSDDEVATVEAGEATGVAVGIAELSATAGGVTSAPVELTVTPAALVAIELSPRGGLLQVGETLALTATGVYSDGATVDVTEVATWESSDGTLAEVEGGLVTAVGVGTALVTASTGGVTSADATLVVSATPLASLAVTPAGASIPKGTTQAFAATGTFEDGATAVLTVVVDWASSDTDVASFDLTGLLSGHQVGATDVTASIRGVTSPAVELTVEPAAVTAVVVSPAAASVAKGRTQAFVATAYYTDSSQADVTADASWTSGAPAIAAVDAAGVATALEEGEAEVSASFAGASSDPALLTVTAKELEELVVAPLSATIAKGETQGFTVEGVYSDGSTEDFTDDASWLSSNSGVATVSAPGAAFGAGVGTAAIRAQHLGLTSNQATLEVEAAIIVSIAVTPADLSLPKGRTGQLTARATLSDGEVVDITGTATWQSDSSDATVSAGLVTAASQGSATLTASQDGVTSNDVAVAITAPVVESVAVAPASASIAEGRTQGFTAEATWSDGEVTDVTAAADWTTTDDQVATVTAGVATGNGTGTAGIAASFEGVSSSAAALTVTAPVVDAIEVDPASLSLAKGRSEQLTATATWSNGTETDISGSATWESTSANATVSAGLVTAAAVGSATVTATQGGVTSNGVLVSISAAEVEEVTVSPATAQLAKGRTQAYTATAHYSDGSTDDVTASASWSSDEPAIAQVNGAGVASALEVGAAEITATFETIASAPVLLTVTAPVLETVTVSPVRPQLAVGFSRPFFASGVFSDGTVSDVTDEVTWSSSDEAVATIDASGRASAASVGSSLVTATAADLGGVSGSTELTVTGATLTAIAVSPNTSQIPTGGVKIALQATGFFNDGSSMDVSETATWSSDDTAAAAVSDAAGEKGLVTSGTPAASTTVAISATIDAVTGTAVVTVVPATLTSIAVSPTNASLPAGYSLSFGAAGTYSDGKIYDLTLTAQWASSDDDVATVSNAFPTIGDVAGIAPGTASISASHAGETGQTTLTVTDAALSSLSLTPASASRAIGLTLAYDLVGVFSDGVTVDLTAVAAWSSSDAAVATISNAAGSAGVATVVGEGSTSIGAVFGGLSASASLTGTTPALTRVVVTPVGATIGVAGFVQMNATAVFSDGTTTDVTSQATWTSNDASVAIVRNDATFRGMVVGASPGTASIVATYGVRSGSRTVTVTDATLAEMYITPALPKIGVGTTVQFEASGVWSDGSTADLTDVADWVSSTPAVATISNVSGNRGLATGVSGGPGPDFTATSTITATYGGIFDETAVTVTAAPLVALHVTPADRSVPLGTVVRYRATAEYDDGILQNVTNQVGWISSDSSVASISNSDGSEGHATAVSGGVVTVTAQRGGVSGSTSLEVRDVFLDALELAPASSLIPEGFARQYTLTGTFSDGSSEDLSEQAGWTTADSEVAVASNAPGWVGMVTGIAPGTTTVVATVFGQQVSTPVEVVDYVLCAIDVTPDNHTIQVGATIQMSAAGVFGASCPAAPPDELTMDITRQVTWRVVPKQRVTVSNSLGTQGMATAVSAGSPAFGNIQAQRTVDGTVLTSGTKLYTTP